MILKLNELRIKMGCQVHSARSPPEGSILDIELHIALAPPFSPGAVPSVQWHPFSAFPTLTCKVTICRAAVTLCIFYSANSSNPLLVSGHNNTMKQNLSFSFLSVRKLRLREKLSAPGIKVLPSKPQLTKGMEPGCLQRLQRRN